jgi:hypothetical protein
MAVAEVRLFDLVELVRSVDGVPAGASGGVVHLLDGDIALVEVTKPELSALDRLVFASLADLRVLHSQ